MTQAGQHGTQVRGADLAPGSVLSAGRFGRLFRSLPVYEHDASQLEAIAAKMLDPGDAGDFAPVADPEPADPNENPLLPAGYTYLGQFIDHDITFDPVSSLQRQNDPDSLHDFRTPKFDLDNLYGRGPDDQPYLYVNGPDPVMHALGFDERGVMLKLGLSVSSDPSALSAGPDLPRNADGRAIIGDPRNDENTIVSQLQSLMLRFHNLVVERTFQADPTLSGGELFRRAQQQVRWHYQWIVINDFLRRIVDGAPRGVAIPGPSVVDDLLRTDSLVVSSGSAARLTHHPVFYKFHNQPYIPVEFSVAAYRFGHSMVRPSYFLNDTVKASKGNARVPIFSLNADLLANLNGFRVLPADWGIDWKYFFEVDPTVRPQHAYKIDSLLSNPLGALPSDSGHAALALLNLKRGEAMSLPSGQTVAKAMGIVPLTDEQLDLASVASSYDGDAPLWYYILKEAELLTGASHLGPVGGRIVAEVFTGLLAGDPLSYLNVEPNWQPTLGAGGDFAMADLVKLVQPRPVIAPPTPVNPSPYSGGE